LKLSDSGLDTAVATHIAAGLAHNASLAELDIGSNHSITSEGWVHLLKALCSNTHLIKLDIGWNKLVMEGSAALAEMLSHNKSLTALSVGSCHIPAAGFSKIARGLLQHTSLQTLEIEYTNRTVLEAKLETLKHLTRMTTTLSIVGKVNKCYFLVPFPGIYHHSVFDYLDMVD